MECLHSIYNKKERPAMTDADHYETFKSNLNLVKAMSGDKAEEEFYNLMEKAKTTFGELHLYMAELYFEYAKFILEKMEKNIDLFNTKELPQVDDPSRLGPVIAEDEFSEDSSDQRNAPQAQEDDGEEQRNLPQIVDDKEQKKGDNEARQEEAEGDDDFQACASNLMCAIEIFEREKQRLEEGGEAEIFDLSELLKFISRCRSRLGDLYHLNENYVEAVEVYRQVIADEEKKIGHESNRGLAEIHYMIANSLLYDNKEGCEVAAVAEFIQAVGILVNHLHCLNPEDPTHYEVPCEGKIKVDRFAYLPKPGDSQEIKEIKEVISCLLDKIEDTHEQISIRGQYQNQLKRMIEDKAQTTFKEISPDTPVMKLGTFGNRKKTPDQKQEQRSEDTEKKSDAKENQGKQETTE